MSRCEGVLIMVIAGCHDISVKITVIILLLALTYSSYTILTGDH